MDRQTFEQKTGLRIVDVPELFTDTSDQKIEVELPCGHLKKVCIKSAVKRKQACTQCNPRKKPANTKEQEERDELMGKLEEMDTEELLTLLSTLSTSTLKKFFQDA